MNESAPETGPAIAVVRSLADFQPRHAAEAKVVAGLGTGDFNRIGNGLCPEGAIPREPCAPSFYASSSLGTATTSVFTRKD